VFARRLPDGRTAYAEPLVIQELCLTCHGATLAADVGPSSRPATPTIAHGLRGPEAPPRRVGRAYRRTSARVGSQPRLEESVMMWFAPLPRKFDGKNRPLVSRHHPRISHQ